MIDKIFKFKKSFLFQLWVFIFARFISCTLIFIYLPLYDPRFFTFKDLEFYKEVSAGIFTPNFLYAYLIKFIGYNSSNIHSYNSLIISFIISIIIFSPWIFISRKILKNNLAILYSIFLGLHPYLSLYSLKFDSTTFAVLPVAFFALQRFLPSKKFNVISLFTTTISSFFRSQILLLAWAQLFQISINKNSGFLRKIKFKQFLILILLVFCSLIQFGYGADILTQNFGCYTLPNIKNFFLEKGFFEPISIFLAYLFTPIIHLILLLSARESIAIYCINLPKELASYWQLNIISTISFLSFHAFCLFKMFKWIFFNNKYKDYFLLIPFILILPNLYGMSHMRYFICFIPYVMLFLFDIKNLRNIS